MVALSISLNGSEVPPARQTQRKRTQNHRAPCENMAKMGSLPRHSPPPPSSSGIKNPISAWKEACSIYSGNPSGDRKALILLQRKFWRRYVKQCGQCARLHALNESRTVPSHPTLMNFCVRLGFGTTGPRFLGLVKEMGHGRDPPSHLLRTNSLPSAGVIKANIPRAHCPPAPWESPKLPF